MLTSVRVCAGCGVLIGVLLSGAAVRGKETTASSAARVTTTLGRFELVIDAETGSLLQLSSPGVGTLLNTTPDAASLVDVAYPVEEFGPLRLASRYSKGAQITTGDDQVAVHWGALGASRSFVEVPGRVSATVTLRAAGDGESVVMRCTIRNRSANAVRQVLFPDLLGLVPTAGASETEFRMGRQVVRPFVELGRPRHDEFFARNSTFRQFSADGKDASAGGRSITLGSARGGLSLSAQGRDLGAGAAVMLHLWERNNKLRLMVAHRVEIGEGATWSSGPYYLTPYKLQAE